mmetsp:Transcript_35651/g.112459  ORF Transcript_35651/g.112459 Transcript_35651/m.112459 type:complete len:466 (-) Transcript_35651:164-1561(-)
MISFSPSPSEVASTPGGSERLAPASAGKGLDNASPAPQGGSTPASAAAVATPSSVVSIPATGVRAEARAEARAGVGGFVDHTPETRVGPGVRPKSPSKSPPGSASAATPAGSVSTPSSSGRPPLPTPSSVTPPYSGKSGAVLTPPSAASTVPGGAGLPTPVNPSSRPSSRCSTGGSRASSRSGSPTGSEGYDRTEAHIAMEEMSAKAQGSFSFTRLANIRDKRKVEDAEKEAALKANQRKKDELQRARMKQSEAGVVRTAGNLVVMADGRSMDARLYDRTQAEAGERAKKESARRELVESSMSTLKDQVAEEAAALPPAVHEEALDKARLSAGRFPDGPTMLVMGGKAYRAHVKSWQEAEAKAEAEAAAERVRRASLESPGEKDKMAAAEGAGAEEEDGEGPFYTYEQMSGPQVVWSKLEGVDPDKREAFLDAATFLEAVGMSKKEFYGQPKWKQTNLKKQLCLW